MKQKTIIILLSIGSFLFTGEISAQMIETVPVYPTVYDSVDIIFHVEQCDCGLMDYTGDIYAHTGVLTDQSTSLGDWYFVIANWEVNLDKAKLEKIDDTTHVLHITPDIYTYYDLTEGPHVEKLAFVFRTPTGSAKTIDLFYDIYDPGLSVTFTKPEDNSIVALDSLITIRAVPIMLGTADPDSLTLYIDNVLVDVSYTNSLEYDYLASTSGQHWIKIVADNGEFTASDSLYIFVREEISIADLPEGVRDGVNSIDDTTVCMVIYAPNKASILVIGDFNNWELSNDYLMKQTPDGNRFWITLTGLTAGDEYAFQYLIDGNLRIADPYTEKILDPNNDPDIPVNTYPDLKPYPYGKTSGIVSTFQTVQENYTWQTDAFTSPAKTDLVIYELHVQNFTSEGNIKALTDTLDYLARLGINAIELMPVNEFEGNQSWGYNPSFYFAFDKIYGTKNDFKAFVDACHGHDIAVIMDIVLNHSYSQSPLVQMYWDPLSNKPAADNPWYNQNHNFIDNTSAHWGYDFNHESESTQNLIDSINSFWMSEYRIDGFRFDFTKGFSNTPWSGTNNWASTYDADRIAILKRMTEEIWLRNEDALVIFEHLAENSEETELADFGIMLWGNMNYPYNEATMGYPSSLNNGTYLSRGWSLPQLVSYMESHDEERLMYKNLRWGNSNASYDVTDFVTAMQRMEAAAAFFFTIPGPKMMFQWGELGYDFSINRCSDGSVDDNGGCRLSLKPVAWELDYYGDPYRYRLFKVFEALIKLRIEEELFETEDFSLSAATGMKKMHLNSAAMNATILGNFGMTNNTLDPAFQHTGTWYDYLTGESLEVSDVSAEISLKPGEYRIYFDQQLETPDIPVVVNTALPAQENEIGVFPNPTNGLITIRMEIPAAYTFELFSLAGERIMRKQVSDYAAENYLELSTGGNLPSSGLYFYKLTFDDHIVQDMLILGK